jgi:hypothetical protein
MTEFFQPPTAVHVDMPPPGLAINPLEMEEENDVAAAAHVVPALPDLNLLALDEEKAEDTPPSAALPTPSPEARVLLRRFAAAVVARPAAIRAGTWSPVKLGLTYPEGGLRLHEPSSETSQR